jgi:hypothetical protein
MINNHAKTETDRAETPTNTIASAEPASSLAKGQEQFIKLISSQPLSQLQKPTNQYISDIEPFVQDPSEMGRPPVLVDGSFASQIHELFKYISSKLDRTTKMSLCDAMGDALQQHNLLTTEFNVEDEKKLRKHMVEIHEKESVAGLSKKDRMDEFLRAVQARIPINYPLANYTSPLETQMQKLASPVNNDQITPYLEFVSGTVKKSGYRDAVEAVIPLATAMTELLVSQKQKHNFDTLQNYKPANRATSDGLNGVDNNEVAEIVSRQLSEASREKGKAAPVITAVAKTIVAMTYDATEGQNSSNSDIQTAASAIRSTLAETIQATVTNLEAKSLAQYLSNQETVKQVRLTNHGVVATNGATLAK